MFNYPRVNLVIIDSSRFSPHLSFLVLSFAVGFFAGLWPVLTVASVRGHVWVCLLTLFRCFSEVPILA